MPAYLESSNSANDPRYERLGFERVGGFTRPDEAVSVSTMWRAGRRRPAALELGVARALLEEGL